MKIVKRKEIFYQVDTLDDLSILPFVIELNNDCGHMHTAVVGANIKTCKEI